MNTARPAPPLSPYAVKARARRIEDQRQAQVAAWRVASLCLDCGAHPEEDSFHCAPCKAKRDAAAKDIFARIGE